VPDLGYWTFVIPGPGAVPRITTTRSIPNNDVAAGKLGRMMRKVYNAAYDYGQEGCVASEQGCSDVEGFRKL
jgi:hypothetical protein